MIKRTVAVVTGTRAEYGLLKHLIRGIENSTKLELKLIVTGTHLSEFYGLTVSEITDDGFLPDATVDLRLENDDSSSLAASIGLAIEGIGDVLEKIKPTIMILLGDRYEMLGAAIAGTLLKIPIAHIHGGEVTEGAFDESIRHSITKMSHIHFVATDQYRKRVIQLGEQPDYVFNFGGLGVDAIKRLKLLDKDQIEDKLGLIFRQKNLLVTFHPVTLENDGSGSHLQSLLEALNPLHNTSLIFTMPNADSGGRGLYRLIKEFGEDKDNVYVYKSLGQLYYFSCMKIVDCVVGNSSSGILEAPSMGVPTLNIGDRQKGRIKADSVIDCLPSIDDINRGLETIYKHEFLTGFSSEYSPYGNGETVEKILAVIESIDLKNIIKKSFYDL